MHRTLHKIALFANDIEYILSPAFKHPRKGKLLADYMRLRIKASCSRWFHFTQERFLSYHVVFPNYEIFFSEFRQIFVRHTYYFSTNTVRPNIIDCGGNIGMATLYFKYLYPEASVTVFEPSREVLPSIEKNLSTNGLTGITLVKAAVYDRRGETVMHPRGAAACGNTLDAGLFSETPEKYRHAPYTVETVLLSDHVTQPVDFLKLDIEGSEGAVLGELERSNKLDLIRNCAMEYHPSLLARDNALSHVLSFFETRGRAVGLYSDDMAPVSFTETGSLCIRTL